MIFSFQSAETPTPNPLSPVSEPSSKNGRSGSASGSRFPTRTESAESPIAPILRPDLQAIADLIPSDVMALDLGCADGELLEYLVRTRQLKGRGIELSEEGVLACVRRGLSVRQGWV